jgi:hypothetical protein
VLWRRRVLPEVIARVKKAPFNVQSDIMLASKVYPYLRHYSFTPPLVSQDTSMSEAAAAGNWKGIAGWFDFDRLYDEAIDRVKGPAVFVELGSWLGRSTAYMAEEIKRRLVPVTFYAVDTWKGTKGEAELEAVVNQAGGDLFPTWQRNMSRVGVFDYVIPLQSDSAAAASRFEDGSVDFCFVDADHSYEAVKADIAAWRPKMKRAGVMAGHDVDRPEVERAVQEAFTGRWRRWERTWIADQPGTFGSR